MASTLPSTPKQAFSIGNVSFTTFEAPEELPISVSQNLAVKDFIGGKRSIQALGTVWKSLKWEGIFWGSDAEYRARLLQRMTAQATVQRLNYLSYAFDVVIADFKSSWKHRWECPYEITVEILNDVSGVVAYTAPSTVDSQIHSSLINASSHIQSMDTGSATAVKPTFQAMSSSLDAAGPAAQATGPSAQSASSSISDAVKAARGVLALPPSTSTVKTLLNVTQYLHNLQVIQKNFQTGQAPKTVSVNGGSLFDIASQFYGDPGLATALQAANGFSSTQLPSGVLTSVILPPLQGTK